MKRRWWQRWNWSLRAYELMHVPMAWWRDGPAIYLSCYVYPKKWCNLCTFPYWTIRFWHPGFCSSLCEHRDAEVMEAWDRGDLGW